MRGRRDVLGLAVATALLALGGAAAAQQRGGQLTVLDDKRFRQALLYAIDRESVPVAWMLEIRTPTIFNRKFRNVIPTALGVNDSFDAVHLAR